ncbi:hypothetical protein D3C71_2103970 [compost metagenome]
MGVTLKTAVPVVATAERLVAVYSTWIVSPIFGCTAFAGLKSQFRPLDMLASKVTCMVRSSTVVEYCSTRWVVPL